MATRRQFLVGVAAVGAAACASGKPAAPTVKPPPPAPPPTPRPEPSAASQPTASPLVDAAVALLGALYAEKIAAGGLEKLRKPLDHMFAQAAKLRGYAFANGDEPHAGDIGNPAGTP